jgi:hypothetical protein
MGQMQTAQLPETKSITTFILRQNIERYRRLLLNPIAAEQRQSVMNLLAQAEAAECAAAKAYRRNDMEI